MPAVINKKELFAWLRLSLEPGLGPAAARGLLAAIGLPNYIYGSSASLLRKHVPEPLAHQISQSPTAQTNETINKTLEWLAQSNNHIITLADQHYPAKLLDISDPPLLLYAKGNIEQLQYPKLAIVGARNATVGGNENSFAFAHYLALGGWSVVSGLALGIDSSAHEGALRAKSDSHSASSTIAVMATGIDMVYPARNHGLAHQIAKHGLLLSELPLGTKALPYQFPRRNRIVAGLSEGVLVVEAARQSGSIITANLAAEYGREVFAIPGSIHSPLSRGCHFLIRQGAKLVESAQDITDELGQLNLTIQTVSTQSTEPTPNRQNNLNAVQQSVINALGYDPVHPNTLLERTGLNMPELTKALLQLQLDGIITLQADGCYQKL